MTSAFKRKGRDVYRLNICYLSWSTGSQCYPQKCLKSSLADLVLFCLWGITDKGKLLTSISLFWFDHGWFWYIPLRDGTTTFGVPRSPRRGPTYEPGGSSGSVAIPTGTRAKLVVSNVRSGGAVHSPELVLDLYSVDVHGEQYQVDTSSVTESNKSGLGANRRTAEFAGGGAGIGALMGAVFGGGKGAGIGALAGAGGGALTQLFTRGKEISVPAETVMTFRLERTLVLHP